MAESDSTRACVQCGEAIVPRINKTTGQPSKRTARFCGRACYSKHFDARRPPRKHVSGPRAYRPAKCLRCGEGFSSYRTSHHWTQYCSRECAQQGRHIRAGTSAILKPIVVRTHHWHCDQCGRAYHIRTAQVSRFCGYECSKLAMRMRHEPRPCKVCDKEFTPIFRWGPPPKCCSESCDKEDRRRMQRVCKGRRRAVTRGRKAQSIDPIAAFERDKWRCHLCGCRTPQALRGTHDPRAPELDHIVTLADGGTHTWGNVACACRACNGAKAARSMGQLGLGFAA